ncbi:4-hydroxythreonine-4-phosphate dehydrogenase [Brevinema andersonii]|uniref:4-hydroxythreonine-4-phosphate dehydrogenase n=1 Tax=Brevinema andersonii TaxID=34097 RepID=A0A1I1EAB6_BREAD|nr:4-hydroxythreonine-4-phosphate dehydrogenase PdxA [Brevinema andersonii]SFB82298.1 4-hydroxythreonine-4-phosphate dehydrogenase [Brevinema andersonii]
MSKIIITLGDPNGIGPEITCDMLSQLVPQELKRIEIIGDQFSCNIISRLYPSLKYYISAHDFIPDFGKISASAGAIAFQNLEIAVSLLRTGQYSGLVTAPVSKAAIVLAGKKFTGHTNYLAEQFCCETEMIFWSENWSTLLATIHIPLSEVSSSLTALRLTQAIIHAHSFAKIYHSESPIVAVAGLNPHAGENGTIGLEEQNIFIPVTQKLQNQGYNIQGPIPGDIVFRNAEQGKYHIVVSPYHDQALTAFKLLHFYDGVNVTTGLPFIRTSPDHGTAFDIAGKNKADSSVMLQALLFVLKKGHHI